jgi:hypothetical protein
MTHKSFLLHLFTTPLYLLGCYSIGYKACVVAHAHLTSSRMTSHHFSGSFPMTEKKEKNRETYLKEIGGGCRAYRVLSFSLFYSIAELRWSALEVTQEHLQNLVSQGHMIAVELATYRVPANPASLAPVGGYVMGCTMFFERGFGVPSHRFLCLLLQFYSLELCNNHFSQIIKFCQISSALGCILNK